MSLLGYRSSVKSKNYDRDLPTAAKTSYLEVSPARQDFNSSSLKSSVNEISKLSKVKHHINTIIGEINEKRAMNQECLYRVKTTNEELLREISPFFNKTTKSEGNKFNQACYGSPKNYSGVMSELKYENEGREQNSNRKMENYIANLQQHLNSQEEKNQMMQHRIAALLRENEELRGSKNHSNHSLPSWLLREFNELKLENERLRTNTIVLLKAKNQY